MRGNAVLRLCNNGADESSGFRHGMADAGLAPGRKQKCEIDETRWTWKKYGASEKGEMPSALPGRERKWRRASALRHNHKVGARRGRKYAPRDHEKFANRSLDDSYHC